VAYPLPPDLAKIAPLYSPAELFWILKHGIKMTGMPSWSDHSDEELWATVAFLDKLPGMNQQKYTRLVMAEHGPWRPSSLIPSKRLMLLNSSRWERPLCYTI
jgi:hypothetical protein